MAAEDSFIVLVLGLSCVARVARQKVGSASSVPVGHSLASAGQGCGDALASGAIKLVSRVCAAACQQARDGLRQVPRSVSGAHGSGRRRLREMPPSS
jgi:hypothetical protein